MSHTLLSKMRKLPARSRRGTLLLLVGLLVLAAAPLAAQEAAASTPDSPGNPLLKALWITLGILVIWFLFYKGLYPFLLRYYGHDASKAIFWPLFLLYSLSWLHLSMYTFYVYGFYYFWLRVTSLFLAVLFSIWFLISLMRRPSV